jgi:hypothetical protein
LAIMNVTFTASILITKSWAIKILEADLLDIMNEFFTASILRTKTWAINLSFTKYSNVESEGFSTVGFAFLSPFHHRRSSLRKMGHYSGVQINL